MNTTDLLLWLGVVGIAIFVIGFIAGELAATIHHDHKRGHR